MTTVLFTLSKLELFGKSVYRIMGKSYITMTFSASYLQQSLFLTKMVLKSFQKELAIDFAKFITAKLKALCHSLQSLRHLQLL